MNDSFEPISNPPIIQEEPEEQVAQQVQFTPAPVSPAVQAPTFSNHPWKPVQQMVEETQRPAPAPEPVQQYVQKEEVIRPPAPAQPVYQQPQEPVYQAPVSPMTAVDPGFAPHIAPVQTPVQPKPTVTNPMLNVGANVPKETYSRVPESIQPPRPFQMPTEEQAPIIQDDKQMMEEAAVAEYERPKQNTLLDSNFTSPIEGNKVDTDKEYIDLPGDTREAIAHALSSTPNVKLADSREGREWGISINNCMETIPFDPKTQEVLERESGQFRQIVDFGGQKLAGGYPRFAEASNQTLKGERAALRLMKHLGLGSIFQVPLWHTGIWVTLKAPAEGEILELHRRLANAKIQFGRHSYGLAHSNTASYVVNDVVSFALDHVYDTTLSDPPEDLKTIINTQDHTVLVWGLACAIYTRGFQYQRACTTNPMKCNYITAENLNLSKLLWVDDKSLTEQQRAHMSKRRAKSVNMEEVKRYQSELMRIQKRVIEVGEEGRKISLTLRTPTLAEFIDSGYRWIDSISSMVNQALGIDGTSEERNEFITRHGKATSLRQYAHWIESIEFDGMNIEDRESVEENLNLITASDIVRNDVLVKVGDYIRDTTIALVGIPTYNCPNCKEAQESEPVYPHHVNVIALDPYRLFFTLTMLRLQMMEER